MLQHKPRHSDENQNHKNVKNNLMILNQVQDDDLKTKNNLDKWLVSELNELIKEVST
ncbi:MAG: hypothetical protein LBQ59_02520 [Candidatus Peribacteria bacterium]|nr:hypothetical protein [Candidatus Peribacteria bacterium]